MEFLSVNCHCATVFGSVCSIHTVKKLIIRMSETPGRPMKYPYTFSAKVAQFPLKYYFQNQWIWRYWLAGGIVLSLPVFYKINKLANSPENVAQWAERRRKEAEAHHH